MSREGSSPNSSSRIDPVLPSSRRPVPVADDVQAELDRRPRTADEIEREIDERTQRLAANVDDLVARMRPGRIASDGVQSVKRRFVTDTGAPRLEVVGAAVGALVGVAVLVWWTRRRR